MTNTLLTQTLLLFSTLWFCYLYTIHEELNILATLSLRESLGRFCAELFYGTVLGTVIASSIANLAKLDPTRSLKMRLLSKGQFMPKL